MGYKSVWYQVPAESETSVLRCRATVGSKQHVWHLRISPVRRPRPILPRFTHSRLKDQMKNIFVGNLSFGATEGSVRSLFEAYGTVDRVSIVTDRDTGQARGFGFVEMSVNADADRAINELNGRDLDGRTLNINEARPKEDRGFGGGGKRPGGGGGFGGQRRNNRY